MSGYQLERVLASAAAAARTGRQPRYLVVATRYGLARHMMVAVPGLAPELLCGHDGDAERTRRLMREGHGSIRLADCKLCATFIRYGTNKVPH